VPQSRSAGRDRFSPSDSLQALETVNSTIETPLEAGLIAKQFLNDITIWDRLEFMQMIHKGIDHLLVLKLDQSDGKAYRGESNLTTMIEVCIRHNIPKPFRAQL
jgi:hypothetical protein